MSEQYQELLLEKFVRSAEEAAATAEKVNRNAGSLNEALLSACTEDEFIILSEPDDIDPELFSKFRLNKKVITNPDKEQLKTITAGVTDAFCGIAATGSVCVTVSRNLTSPASMLTRKHIVVLDSKTIIPMPRNVFSEEYLEGKGLKRSFTFITGPSATADMGPLVRGVHGPGKLHIIILE